MKCCKEANQCGNEVDNSSKAIRVNLKVDVDFKFHDCDAVIQSCAFSEFRQHT